MAEQAEKFGGRVREKREELDWEQKDLVARMHELGDQAINTNQLSRYENGKVMARERRQAIFAEALTTEVADLQAGPVKDRKPAKKSKGGKDLLDQLSARAADGEVEKLLHDLAGHVMGIGAELEGAVGLLMKLSEDLQSVQADLAILKRRKAS